MRRHDLVICAHVGGLLAGDSPFLHDVEGVARRIDTTHDIWAAAEPVVRRELGGVFALAIAFFYAVGTAIGGITDGAPTLAASSASSTASW